ncbi:MAG: site-specific integrase [Oscillatoriales cyanobacterium]|uniref:site-specific integrase n=1 Tax=Microcoleus anatoxicus TaxID=2705319 RepID=UPI0030C9B12C|nr:MAG: site-specific integrase [Oscillatoriales cyanobacterium]
MKKFSVRIVRDKDSLRLEWTYQGQRRTLYPGLADTKTNRIKAREIALQIESDVETGTYNGSISKYKKAIKPLLRLNPTELFEIWLEFKKNSWDQETFKTRSYLKTDLTNFFKDKKDYLTKEDVKKFYYWLSSKRLASDTFNRKLDNFELAWDFLLESGQVAENPWRNLPRRKTSKTTNSKPFTKTEINKILTAFEAHKTYKHYTVFVKFLFGTGCRIGEAIGIRWKDLDLESGKITILEQVTSGQRKAAKSGSCREFYLSGTVKILLKNFKPATARESDLVFTTLTGKPIDDHNFRERPWVAILALAGVEYRKPSNTRHTFCSHALESGVNPVTVAAVTGHDPKVLFDHYAGLIGKPEAPEIF